MAYKDIDVRKAHDRERFRKRTAARRAPGFGTRPRDARRRAAGVKRRRNPAGDRERSRRQAAERVARNLCARCGKTPPEPDRRLCEPCAAKRRAAERALSFSIHPALRPENAFFFLWTWIAARSPGAPLRPSR